MVYCLVPSELAPKLHDPLRRHFRNDTSVEVVVEMRGRERRASGERRSSPADEGTAEPERRQIRGEGGRRVGERRAALVEGTARPLPRRLQRFASHIAFVERIELPTQQAEDLDTARLITRFQAGETDVFGELYLRYFDRAYAYLRLALDDSHEAQDATQEVFIRVFNALPRYQRRSQPFRAWLFRIIKNYAYDELQRLKRVATQDPFELSRQQDKTPAPGTPVDLDALSWISDREMLLFIERLPAAQQQVVVLRYMLDLSNGQIATLLDRKPEEIRVLHYRAMNFLRDRLTAVGKAPADRGGARMRRRFRQAPVLRGRRWALAP